ncbi:topoisomerase DNA-binding C4 zinc finger domain-containing protein [Anaerotignum sp. MSJ-24]|nr:topoisomerase DNA-binding C4 zinc finger domain-containing protein [Anaerotignum sp. MSJ-24]
MQNNLHIRWLKKLTDDETLPFYSYIVFSDRCELKNIDLSSDDKHVIKRYDILSEVNKNVKNVGTKLTNEKIDELYNTLYPLTQADAEQKLKHIEDIKKKYDIQENKPETVAEENKTEEKGKLCPKCGGRLVLRTTKNGEHKGEKFWGCSNFPKCRYIEKI